MNELVQYDAYVTTSLEERRTLLERFKSMGINVGDTTWENRNQMASFLLYPVLFWDNSDPFHGALSGTKSIRDTHTALNYNDFIRKSGVGEGTPQGDSKLKFYFIR